MSMTHAFAAEIVKSERDDDGNLVVYGKATGPDLDLDGQICDPKWLQKAMPDWMTFGNVREMHQPIAAGVGVELTQQGDDWYLKSLCIDQNTAKKIETKVLTGYSVGINSAKVVKDALAPGGRIVDGRIVEVSYVDRPCNPTAKMAIAKMGKTASTLEAVEAVPAADDSAETAADDSDAVSSGIADAESAKGDEGERPGGDTPEVTAADSPALESAEQSAAKSLARGVGRTILSGLAALKMRNGRPVITKAAPSEDIASAEQCMSAIGALIQSEAQGLIDGQQCDAYQISTLLRAYEALQCFCTLEAYEAAEDAVEVVLLADQPTLTKSADATDPTKSEPIKATETKTPSTSDEGTEVTALKAELATLREQVAKVLSRPVPGGPVLARSAPDIEKADGRAALLAKAAQYDRLASDMSATDPNAAKGFRELAAAARSGL